MVAALADAVEHRLPRLGWRRSCVWGRCGAEMCRVDVQGRCAGWAEPCGGWRRGSGEGAVEVTSKH